MKEELKSMLILAARKGQLVTYGQIDKRFSFSTNPFRGWADMYRLLMKIGDDEIKARRPLLNSIVVRTYERVPGIGFFKWYKKRVNLDFNWDSYEERILLSERLTKEVFDYWVCMVEQV